MKKFKKIFAVLLTLAMVMGMSMTTFAAGSTVSPYLSNIKITGLASGEKTTVNAFRAVYLNDDENEWVVADWAKDYIELDSDKKAYKITDAVKLGENVPTEKPYTTLTSNGEISVTFENVPVGAYVLLASGDKNTTYTTMVANTYKADSTYMESQDVNIVAKTSSYTVDKSADDNFVARGEVVEFTVETIFPSFPEPESSKNSFKIIDTPVGLNITGVTLVTIGGGENLTEISGSSLANGQYVIDLSSQIGTSNENAGKIVKVMYEAIVSTDEGYSNTVNISRNDVEIGGDITEGFTGNVILTKKSTDNTTLAGAEFTVAKKDETNKLGDNLYFVKIVDGEYKLALSSEETGATTTVVATNGTVKLTGLDEGTYHFTETKAPEGYSINAEGVDVVITENTTEHVSVSENLIDTKLSALPSTGGIGTTIFTIGGCLIMIVAAGLFFANRKKSNK